MPNSETAKTASALKHIAMNVLLVDNKSAHLELLQALVSEKLSNVTFTVRDPRDMQEHDAETADLVIVSGGVGRSIVKNPETFRRMVSMIARYQKPTIGICLGAEAIAVFFGGNITEMPVRRVGNVRVNFEPGLSSTAVFEHDSFMAYEFHRWKITGVPEPLEVLATSKDGIEVFRHTTLPIWGLQFHPEVRRNDNPGHIIFEKILATFNLS